MNGNKFKPLCTKFNITSHNIEAQITLLLLLLHLITDNNLSFSFNPGECQIFRAHLFLISPQQKGFWVTKTLCNI